ncbi:MAG: PRC-barrel domain-containing protein [Solirubrobacteraceae bacterium]
MSQSTEFEIGSEVVCSDGPCGSLERVVLDPVARAITHLVVASRLRRGSGHLVPVDRVASAGKEVRLNCTRAELEQFDKADDTELLTAASDRLGYPQQHILMWPYYGLHMAGIGMSAGGTALHAGSSPTVVTHDHVPLGDVEVRRGEHVHATDGAIGRVKGLVIDPADHHVTHFLLDEGHLWGHRRVAIPISAVTRVGDGVRIGLTKDQVRDLPPVEVDRPD